MLRPHVWQLRRALPFGVAAAVLLSACGGGSKSSIAERARDRLVVDSSHRLIAAESERVPDGWTAERYYFGPLPGKTPKNPVSGDAVVWDPVPTQGIGGMTAIARGETRPEGCSVLVGRIEPNGSQVPDVVNFSGDQDAAFTAGTMQLVEVGVACPIGTRQS
ncbi:MAG TPA: hypothetical protein VEL76_10320 [Gemmataceae bacterium]|nr:hypothetical protein [Gemmataceae bacterium]